MYVLHETAFVFGSLTLVTLWAERESKSGEKKDEVAVAEDGSVGGGGGAKDLLWMPPEKMVAYIDVADLIQMEEEWETKPRRYFTSRASKHIKEACRKPWSCMQD